MNLASTTGSIPLLRLDPFIGAPPPVPSQTRSQPAPLLPALDPVVAAQVRFSIDGTGPVAARTITPASEGAAELVRTVPTAVNAVRGVLQLVELAAGGAAASASVDLDGVAFATDAMGFAANTWRAHADAPAFRSGLAKLSPRSRAGVLEKLAMKTARETGGMLANVASTWMNVGPEASAALLARAGVPAATPVSTPQLAQTVRVLMHEAVHAVDTEPANLPAKAMHGVWEALAEARTMNLPQLRRARSKLGLDDVVSDSALAQTLQHRPYAAAERTLAGVLKTAGIVPGSMAEQRVLHATANDAVELLTTKLSATTGFSPADARTAIATAFGESMPGSR